MNDLISNTYSLNNTTDLQVDGFGYQNFERRQIFLPPRICSVYMLHFVIKGKGTLTLEDRTYPLKSGALFFCPTNVYLTYHTSKTEPYSYYWLNFVGANAEEKVRELGLSRENPVIYPQNVEKISEIFRHLMNFTSYDSQDMALACLHSLFFYAKDGKSPSKKKPSVIYVEKAIDYINSNYQNPELRISHLAEELHISCEYLSKIFREETKTTLVSFLISKRMEEAHKLLKLGLSVTETAVKCGYIDLCNFSKTYTKRFGYTPSETV